jgi:gamma-glutamyltranspeptidase
MLRAALEEGLRAAVTPRSGRPPARAERSMVAASHPLAADVRLVGLALIDAGGNADPGKDGCAAGL